MIHWAPALPRSIRKLVEFKDLPIGWHYGRGGPIDRSVLAAAEDVVHQFMMMGFHLTDAFPGVDGEVQITAYHKSHSLSVTLNSADKLSFVHEFNNKECCERDELTMSQLRNELRRVASEIWGTSVSSTPATLNMIGVDSAILPSRYPLRMAGSPSSTLAALRPPLAQSAHT